MVSQVHGGIIGGTFFFCKNDTPAHAPDNGPALRRKPSDAFMRSVAESGKYADGEVPGLYLHVMAPRKAEKPASNYWRMKYRLRGKENVLAIGSYPDIGLNVDADVEVTH